MSEELKLIDINEVEMPGNNIESDDFENNGVQKEDIVEAISGDKIRTIPRSEDSKSIPYYLIDMSNVNNATELSTIALHGMIDDIDDGSSIYIRIKDKTVRVGGSKDRMIGTKLNIALAALYGKSVKFYQNLDGKERLVTAYELCNARVNL